MASGILLTEQDVNKFRAEYGDLIRKQCVSLMGDTKAAKDLEERVIRYVRDKYEYQPLPEHCETMLIAQCCIFSGEMEPAVPDMDVFPGTGTAAPSVTSTDMPVSPVSDTQAGTAAGSTEEADAHFTVPEEIRRIKITAVYDPKKTAVWFPDGLKPDRVHLQADPEDPEEETAERSVPHSILNTFLVIIFLSSIVFFMWKTGLLRWLKRFLEGLFIYG